jgi:outer membrane protein TolC
MRTVKHGLYLDRWISFLSILSISLWSLSARADVVRLTDLEANALRNAPIISASQARISQANARLDRAEDAYYPTFSIDATGTAAPGQRLFYLKDDEVYVTGSSDISKSNAFVPWPRAGLTLGIRDNLYDFGRRSAAVDAANADRTAQEADAHATKHNVLRAVRAAYLRWATTYALWELAQGRARAAQSYQQRIEAFVKEGAIPQADSTTAAAQSAKADMDAERAAADAEAARLDLSHIASRDLPQNAEPEPAVLDGRTTVLARKESADPIEETLDAQRIAAESTARMHDYEHAPLIAATANAGVEARYTSDTKNNNAESFRAFLPYSLGVSISVPLWDGGASSAQSDEARAKAAELSALAEERRAIRRHSSARTRAAITHAQREIALVERWVALCEKRMRELGDSEDVSAKGLASLTAAQVDLDRARIELILARSAQAEANLGLLEP